MAGNFPENLFPVRESENFKKLKFDRTELDFLVMDRFTYLRGDVFPYEYIVSVGPVNFVHLQETVYKKVRDSDVKAFVVNYITKNKVSNFDINYLDLSSYLKLAESFKVMSNGKYVTYREALSNILYFLNKINHNPNFVLPGIDAKYFDETYLKDFFVLEECTFGDEYRKYLSELSKYEVQKEKPFSKKNPPKLIPPEKPIVLKMASRGKELLRFYHMHSNEFEKNGVVINES